MIEFFKGTIFNTHAKTLVNTVNTEGVMGAGLALEMSLRCPEMFKEYQAMCKNNTLLIGEPKLHEINKGERYILSFPTKKSWKYPAKIEYIKAGLETFQKRYSPATFDSIAFPKLGVGKGQLDWEEVKEVMLYYLEPINDLKVFICLDELSYAEGLEKEMLLIIQKNLSNDYYMKEYLGMSDKIIETMRSLGIPYRFRDFQKYPGIGKKRYETLFTRTLNLAQPHQESSCFLS